MKPGISLPYLFTESGLRDLDRFVDKKTLFAFDLDGTLAPITSDPRTIRISGKIRKGLARLINLAVVAIVTGRSRYDAQSHLGIVPQFLIGNHGAEGLPGWQARERGFAEISSAWEKQLRGLIPPEKGSEIYIENKGTTLSIHYRAAHNKRQTRVLLLQSIEKLIPRPRRIPGKCVENLLPGTSPDKGTAIRYLLGLSGSVKGIYVGDDVTDEEVFRLDGDRLLTIRVGTGSRSQARYRLREQSEVTRLLEEINCRI
jgi:trehalose 6-phosphate phosphatase